MKFLILILEMFLARKEVIRDENREYAEHKNLALTYAQSIRIAVPFQTLAL